MGLAHSPCASLSRDKTLPPFDEFQDHPPAMNHLDSSSNPSSTTSSTPSSPAPFQSSNPPSATPPPNPSPMGQRDSRFNFPGNWQWRGLEAKLRNGNLNSLLEKRARKLLQWFSPWLIVWIFLTTVCSLLVARDYWENCVISIYSSRIYTFQVWW